MPCASERILISLISCSVLLVACTTPRPENVAPCVTKDTRDLVLRWGTEDDSLNVIEVYRLNTKGEVFYYKGPRKDTITDDYKLHIDQRDYCTTASSVNSCFLKTQALNSRGRKGRFIEYFNPSTDVYLRAVWNPDLQTFQSRDMRKEYEQLMSILDQ
ncbi:MAG: hypothetical protein FGM32_06555 [Candidatus Kapabacteria bacterium]|nr:hypothetical protein [Candidatus Kapabacteria bacterium]